MRRLVLCLLGASIPATPAVADPDAQAWLTMNATGSVSGKVFASIELQGRASNDQGRVYETQLVGLVGYRATPALTLAAGYSHIIDYHGTLPTTFEDRLRQQVVIVLARPRGGTLATRGQLEERFREDAAGTGWRYRQQLKLTLPFRKKGRFAFVSYHESFFGLNATRWGQQAGYDRMRNFIGVTFPLAKSLRAETGYLNQYDFVHRAPNRMAHVASLTLSYSF